MLGVHKTLFRFVKAYANLEETMQQAFADYDDIRVLKNATPTHSISQILKAE